MIAAEKSSERFLLLDDLPTKEYDYFLRKFSDTPFSQMKGLMDELSEAKRRLRASLFFLPATGRSLPQNCEGKNLTEHFWNAITAAERDGFIYFAQALRAELARSLVITQPAAAGACAAAAGATSAHGGQGRVA